MQPSLSVVSELGIPAIVGLNSATTTIPDGASLNSNRSRSLSSDHTNCNLLYLY